MQEVVANEENGAGATLDITSMTDGIDAVETTNSELPASITYYNMSGMEISSPQPGINIVKIQYADGRTVNRKIRK